MESKKRWMIVRIWELGKLNEGENGGGLRLRDILERMNGKGLVSV